MMYLPYFSARRAIVVSTALCCTLLPASTSAAQQFLGPMISQELRRGVTPPLRSMKPVMTVTLPEEESEDQREGRRPLAIDAFSVPFDPVIQASTPAALNVNLGPNFEGIPGAGFTTSDANGSVGATQYVQYVNSRFAVYDKATGNKTYGPAAESTLWQTLGGACATSKDGDIIVLYDKQAKRWIFTHHAAASGSFYQCFAISRTSDATGAYFLYVYQLTNQFPDYPKLGVWSDGYYLASTLENPTTFAFVASQVCAFNRSQMLAGAAAQEVCFQTAAFDSLLPADIDGATAPPLNASELFLSLTLSDLKLFKFHVNWADLPSSTFTGPTPISIAAFNPGCGGLQCIPQLDTSQVLDSLADRLMYRLAYRNFGLYDLLTLTHTVTASGSTGLRWYEIRRPRGTPQVRQQGTYAPDSKYRWMGSVAMDKVGNMALGYSISSATQHPGINFTGRLAADPLGTMESEINVVKGAGSQQAPNYRWGDYTSMSIDPVDDCTFWYTNQYYKTDSVKSWSTRVVSFKFPSCH